MEFREHRLENGLEIVAECNPNALSTAFGFFVRTGSRDESDQNWGISHFLEHMVFKGTTKRTAADVNRELDEIGSNSNAYTSEEQTVYYAAVLAEYQDRAVELLADIMRPALRDDDFNMEKQVILEEIAKYEDQPPFGANEKALAVFFGTHPLGRSVLGTIQSVSALTPEQMRTYFEQRYCPSNITLVASGNVHFDRLVELAHEQCGHWPQLDADRAAPPVDPQAAFNVIQHPLATQEYAIEVSLAPAAEDDDRYAARLLSLALGDDGGSRLYWELVETGKAEYAATEYYSFQGSGVFMTFLSCHPDAADANLQRIEEIWRQVHRDGVRQEELEQAKNKLCSHIILASERASSRLFSVGSNWIKRRTYQTVRQVVEAYREVTLDQVHEVLEKYPLTHHATVAVGPRSELHRPR